jgi:hypothetical protein
VSLSLTRSLRRHAAVRLRAVSRSGEPPRFVRDTVASQESEGRGGLPRPPPWPPQGLCQCRPRGRRRAAGPEQAAVGDHQCWARPGFRAKFNDKCIMIMMIATEVLWHRDRVRVRLSPSHCRTELHCCKLNCNGKSVSHARVGWNGRRPSAPADFGSAARAAAFHAAAGPARRRPRRRPGSELRVS